MLKKLTVMLALAALGTLCLPAQAAKQYPNFEAAKAKVTSAGYIAFIYPADWDRYGEKLCRTLIADPEIRKAAGDAALLLVPIYQNRNEANNAKANKARGSLGIPGDMADITFPALLFYEEGGRQYASIQGTDLVRANTAEVAALIQQRMTAKKEQDALLKKANAATTPAEKSRYYLESSRVSGIDWPGGLRNAMQKANPNDEGGYLAALNYGFGIQKDESIESLTKRLDEVLANELYTPWQKQRACAVAIGHIRRSMGTRAGGPLISKYGNAMHKLDPKSSLGLAGPVVARDWVQEYRYGQGWSPEVLPGGVAPVLMQDVPMNKPGTYTVKFKLVTGRDAVYVKKLRLLDGSRCVVEDNTPRDVTWGQTQQSYTLTVKKNIKNPVLEITYGNAPDKRSSWGEITITKN